MFADVARSNLVKIAAAYSKATGESRSQISRRFYGRGNFLAEFTNRRQSISIDKLDELIDRFRQEWPPGAEWPILPSIRMSRG